MLISSPTIRALPGGGYGHPIALGEKRVVIEDVLFPFDPEINGDRDQLILIPPAVIVDHDSAAMRSVFVFAVTGAVATDTRLLPTDQRFWEDRSAALAAIPTDATEPTWLRLMAMNWIAEGRNWATPPRYRPSLRS
jgi:hypothetical protein